MTNLARHWLLDPRVTFLNHGSFGACPEAVLEAQSRIRRELESQPVAFFASLLERRLDEAREPAARFVGAVPERFAFVRNSTAGVNAVLRSLSFEPGDVLLATDHTYNACKNALEFVATRSSAELRVVHVPMPVRDPADVTDRIVSAAAKGKVRLLLVDHVTSMTGLVLPVADIVREMRERGIETLVDGAHAPGMVDVDVEQLGAAYYVGNFHKWVCAPKGAAMLCVREDVAPGIHPPVISHGYGSMRARARFLEEFDWAGTDDPSPWLCVPEAIRFVASLAPGGWPEVRERNRALVLQARRSLLDAVGSEPIAPETMIGSLASVRVPLLPPPVPPFDEALHRRLLEEFGIEVPIFVWSGCPDRLLRVSAHLYNKLDEYERLAQVLGRVVAESIRK